MALNWKNVLKVAVISIVSVYGFNTAVAAIVKKTND